MSLTLNVGISLGSSMAGLTDLRAKLYDEDDVLVGSAFSATFDEIGNGEYTWETTTALTGFRYVEFYSLAAPAVTWSYVFSDSELGGSHTPFATSGGCTRLDIRLRVAGVGYCNDFTGDDTMEVHRVFPREDKNVAINEAIRSAGATWMIRLEDEAITVSSSTYTYALTALAVAVDPVFGIDALLYDTDSSSTGFPFKEIPNSFYQVRENLGVPTLQFLREPPINNQVVRVVYRVRPGILTTEASGLTPDDQTFCDYVAAKATALLCRSPHESVSPEMLEYYLNKSQEMDDLAERILKQRAPQSPGADVRNETLLWGKSDFTFGRWS